MRVFCLEKDQGEKYLTFKDCRLVQSESILSREGPRGEVSSRAVLPGDTDTQTRVNLLPTT